MSTGKARSGLRAWWPRLPSPAGVQAAASWAVRSPFAWILFAVFVVHLVGITWGLPASDGWDDDGIAPRDFLVGALQTFVPGQYFTYPPVHLLLLSVLCSPVAAVALFHAHSLAPVDIVREFIQVPYMTFFALVARSVSVAMSVGIVWALSAIGEELFGRRARNWVAAAAGANAVFAYYAHTTNLDVPSLFYASFALLFTCRALARGEPRRLRKAFLFAALAVGTKDQTYALFLLALPAVLVAWAALPGHPKGGRALLVRETAIATLRAAVVLLAVDGALTNPTGFRRRLAFLAGTASQDHAYYAKSWGGAVLVLRDVAEHFTVNYPLAFAGVAAVGLVWALAAARPAVLSDAATAPPPNARIVVAPRLAAALPLLAMISFTLAFNCTARRTEERFVLPQWLLVSVYVGLGFEALDRALHRLHARVLLVAGAGVAFAYAVKACLAVDANLLGDPRYDAEAWLTAHAAPGDVIEVYGNNVYLPRFPPQARVVRVGDTRPASRNPLPDVTEVEAPYFEAPRRDPRFILTSDGWVWRYLSTAEGFEKDGHTLSAVQRAALADTEAREYFHALLEGRLGYHWAHESSFVSPYFDPVNIHASTSRHIRIFERNAPPPPASR